ncbi:alpha beta hydrolase [Cryptosporidium sp. chipmunk genotype I]|uniref:alpha beta hydrolase n=1 Tax=Cryptosporidium sp. chipmunk genotype I TaxID=1280935 RepID=UPI00351A17D0|nr:alpha beta hydrolase [Cryptosporidium sp. chipmunk genotype I]
MSQNFQNILRINGILTYVESNFSITKYLAQDYKSLENDKVLIYIYNHGFPDYSVNYNDKENIIEFQIVNNYSGYSEAYKLEIIKHLINDNIKLSRFCGKMRDICLSENHINKLKEKSQINKFLFISFNTNGIGELNQRGEFYNKTLTKDMYDIETIVEFFSNVLFKNSRLIMIGISTGAFLTFSYSTNYTRRNIKDENNYFISNSNLIGIICIACVDNIPESYNLDFNNEQLYEFKELGYTNINTKIPIVNSNVNKINDEVKLISKDYLESYNIFPTYNFLLKNKEKVINCPVLLIHGTDDQSVPFKMSLNLLNLNNDYSNKNNKYLRLVEIINGNHLLTNSKHIKKAQNEISNFVLEII